KVAADDIVIGVPKMTDEDREAFDPVRKGTVSFFDHSKGFGFIVDGENQEKYFTHVSGLIDEINEGNAVSFELEKGQRGMNAVKVTLVK
ncbi:MAG TPA: DNA-binding protein, partial [Flavobacteriaceae bacterium]|nr:DNA-binding protein [Flavobacteriaceae bacterium]